MRPADVTDTCHTCGAPILWARTTANAKAMPLNPTPYRNDDQTANVAVYRDHTRRLIARVLRAGEQPFAYERRAMPHFATCTRTPHKTS